MPVDYSKKLASTDLRKLRQIISLGALALAFIHIVWPGLAIDAVALALLVIAILPWIAPLVKSLEIPGGWKVEFQEIQKTASRAESAGLLAEEPASTEKSLSYKAIAKNDPNLALAGLRIEIEKRLSQLAEAHGVIKGRPMGVGQLLKSLTQADVLTHEERTILADMVNMLNAAVHGAIVDRQTAEKIIDIGPRLLASLDERIIEANVTADDLVFLRKIVSSTDFPYHIYKDDFESVERLRAAKFITMHDCSDGPFVRYTDKGKHYADEKHAPNPAVNADAAR